METYIVRIYQRDNSDPKKIAGVVEGIGKQGRRGFLGPESLWRILTMPWRESNIGGETGRSAKKGHGPTTLTEIMKQIEKVKK